MRGLTPTGTRRAIKTKVASRDRIRSPAAISEHNRTRAVLTRFGAGWSERESG